MFVIVFVWGMAFCENAEMISEHKIIEICKPPVVVIQKTKKTREDFEPYNQNVAKWEMSSQMQRTFQKYKNVLLFPNCFASYTRSALLLRRYIPDTVIMQKDIVLCLRGDDPDTMLNDWLQASNEPPIPNAFDFESNRDYVGIDELERKNVENGVLYTCFFQSDSYQENKGMQENKKNTRKVLAYWYRNILFIRNEIIPGYYDFLSDDELMLACRTYAEMYYGERQAISGDAEERMASKKQAKMLIHNTDTEIRKFVTAVPQGQYAHDLYPDNSGSKRKKELGLQDGPIHNTIPNVNEGKCTEGAVQSFIKQHPSYTRTYSEGGKVSYAATVQSTGNRIDYQIAHHVNPDQAMNMLFHFIAEFPNLWSPIPESSKRYVRYTPGSGPLKSLGRVGDFDMPLKDYLTPDGMLIEGSDKSAVFFIRGNTAVGIQSVDPTVDVLPWAREIDEKLKKNMEAVTEKE